MTDRPDVCRCGHDKPSHYQDRATRQFHACLAPFCRCDGYERDAFHADVTHLPNRKAAT